MNKIYRIVWNSVQQCFVVTSELAKGKGKNNNGVTGAVAGTSLLFTSLALFAPALSAAPIFGPVLVNDTTATFADKSILSNGNGKDVLTVQGANGNATATSVYISTSDSGASAFKVQSGAVFNLLKSRAVTLMSDTVTAVIEGGATLNISDSELATLNGGSTALLAKENSVVNGRNVSLNSYGIGLRAIDAKINIEGATITTMGDSGYGVYASGSSDINLQNATVNTSNTASHAIFADGGKLNASNTAITTSGSGSYGLYAEGGSTQVQLDGGTIASSDSAVYADNGAQLDIRNMEITSSADSTFVVDGGAQVTADSVTLTSAKNGYWIGNSTFNGNNLTINALPGDAGAAIVASSGSDVTLTNSTLNLDGGGIAKKEAVIADAGTAKLNNIAISSDNGGVALTASNDGTINAKSIAAQISTDGVLPASGMVLAGGTGANLIHVEESNFIINGHGAEAIVSQDGEQTATLKNTQVISDNTGVSVHAGSGLTLNLDNSAIAAKTLLQGGQANSGNLLAQNATINASNGSQLTGDVSIDRAYTADSAITLDTVSVWSGASSGLQRMQLNSGSRWNVTGDSDVGALNLNDSTLAFASGSSFKTLTVDGDYSGSNGTLVFNSVLDDDSSAHDRLVVNGNTSGTTNVVVNRAGGNGAQTLNGIELIQVYGTSAGDFRQQGRIVAGAYDYNLLRGQGSNSGNWYLSSEIPPTDSIPPDDGTITPPDDATPPGDTQQPQPEPKPEMILRPEAGSYMANMRAVNSMFNLRLQDRGGETLYVDALTGEKKATSMWLRSVGAHQQSRDNSGQLNTESNRYVMQLGGDLVQGSVNGTDSLHLGAMAGYGNARSKSDAAVTGYHSEGHVNGYSLGLYGTWYQQPETRTGAYVDSWLQYGWFNNSVSGEQLDAEHYKSRGITASLEGGYRWKLGADRFKNSYFIEPNAQLTSMNVKADEVKESNGTRVSSQGAGNLQSRLGVRFSLESAVQKDQAAFSPFIEANWLNNSKTIGSTMDDVAVSSAAGKNVAEVRVGVNSALNNKLNLWGSIGQQAGSNHFSDTSATLGIKYNF